MLQVQFQILKLLRTSPRSVQRGIWAASRVPASMELRLGNLVLLLLWPARRCACRWR